MPGYQRINIPETEMSSFKISLYIDSNLKINSSKNKFLFSEHNNYFLPLQIQNWFWNIISMDSSVENEAFLELLICVQAFQSSDNKKILLVWNSYKLHFKIWVCVKSVTEDDNFVLEL